MKTATALLDQSDVPGAHEEEHALLDRILASRHFAKSPLLSRFLRYICESHLSGMDNSLTEHHIGVNVFGRAAGYDCSNDNIVRNYARQLRSRLDDYFRWEGGDESLRLDVPRGGYKPIFARAPLLQPLSSKESTMAEQRPRSELAMQQGMRGATRIPWIIITLGGLVLVLLIAVGVLVRAHARPLDASASPMHPLWLKIFSPDRNTVIVTADSGFGTLQDVLGRRLSLAEYMSLKHGATDYASSDPYIADDLASQRYTSMVDLQAAVALSHLPEVVPNRLSIRFARDLRIEDLSSNNVILIGSEYTNPWAELFEKNFNFQFQGDTRMHTWSILNRHPAPGELKLYRGERDQASHLTYARVGWLPNLDHTGHVLMLQGLDMAGTQAAVQSLLNSKALAGIWRGANACATPDASFEVLLSTTSIGSNAGTFRVLATRQSC